MNRTWQSGLLAGLALGAASIALTSGLWAQTPAAAPPTGRFAVIDVVKVFNEYERQKDLVGEMNKVRERLELENTQRRQKIDGQQAALDALDPADPTYGAKREFLQAQIDYKNWFDLNEAALGREIGVWTAKVYREITKACGDIALKNGYDVVLYKDEFEAQSFDPNQVREQIRDRKLLHYNPSIDISQGVLDALNAAYRQQPKSTMLQIP